MSAPFKLCSLTQLKIRRKIESGDDDTVLNALIDDISDRVGGQDTAGSPHGYLNRHVQSVERTEIYRVDALTQTMSLKGYPIDESETFRLKYNDRRSFTGVSEVETDDYDFDPTNGLVHVYFDLGYKPTWIEVLYTGGMTVDAASWLTDYPVLVSAVEEQVIHEYNKRKSPGEMVKMRAGTIEFDPELRWLPNVLSKLEAYRRNNG